jgi:RNA polymerase sigma factor (sigma-70 family)
MEILTNKDSIKWASFLNGNDQAFTDIYSVYSVKLFRYGLKITANHSVIEDAIQDLFSELIRNRRTLGQTNNILFYLMKAFKRKLLRHLQKENRFGNTTLNAGHDFLVTYSIEHEIISDELSKQKADLLIHALKELTPRQKEAIYLRYTQELEYKEISEVMEMSIEACRNLISKAIKALKDAIQGEKASALIFLFLSLNKYQ